ncbi:CopG family ribbon-helix-helix protein [Jiella mangrovi]|uniref:CopG family transcriptional regulator n=1 Tax=Jiella mangrovi TaxID=2821407 RepID=A0ABS4BHU9_9HYPH|nr:hypothetical protein [Jiella mangrovi]MBP0616329.1 hypothetical protein [Jiella mangrovi]
MASGEFSISVEPDVKAALETEARLSNATEAQIAEQAITQYLAGRKLKREAVRHGLKEAEKGVFVSHEAVTNWVESWGTADELPPPEPDVFFRR